MKKIFFLMIAVGLAVSACGTSAKPSVPSGAAVNPSPISEADLQATAAILSLQTLQAQPTLTLEPSATPVIETATITSTPTVQATVTETQNPILLTLTATLGTGTPLVNALGTPLPTGTLSATLVAPTELDHPQTYGTMPPNLPSGKVTINNQIKSQASVSLQCTTKEGFFSEIDFSVGGKSKVGAKSPAGSCVALIWVDGKRFSARFHLGTGGNVTVTVTNKSATVSVK